jgi:GT2 family glycosyltransferase/2-polyprenyl-3-methyl-5-hydroxy-6-metoxy-1,4-benzoquinol methylase
VRATDLSVVIPTRERWPILERTLAALAAQTVRGFEVIVVCDGADQAIPASVRDADGVRVLVNDEHAGPGVARNLGARCSRRPLLLLLGDDMLAEADLIERHLIRHHRQPVSGTAVLGRVRWHPQVAGGRLMRWLEWSGAQFDYRQLDREQAAGLEEAGFGRFYSCNVSLHRELFLAAGGFDPDFRFDYEDLDFGWRLHQQGMRLLYEPRALALHLHRHDWESVQRRYESRARAEQLMQDKHDWFRPWFHGRIAAEAAHRPLSPVWQRLVDHVPGRGGARSVIERRADRWYHQQLAPRFLAAWEGERDLRELREYLGERYEQGKLVGHRTLIDDEAAAAPDEATFYRTSELYLYDLTAFAMSGVKDVYRGRLTRILEPAASVLDYGCGIGSDGLRLLERGYRVAFADFENPSVSFLRWRLARRGLSAPVYDIDGDVPGGFDAAFAFDVIEHVDDPLAFLAELEQRAAIVAVNLLEPVPDDTPLHRELPIRALLAHAAERGLLHHRRYHGRSHLVIYRSARKPGPIARAHSVRERVLGALLRG